MPSFAELCTTVGVSPSGNSKLDCLHWGLSPDLCKVGRRLARTPGTVCQRCYACKGRYRFAPVRRAQARRLAIYRASRATWVRNFTQLLQHPRAGDRFRWFDAGDLQGLRMLQNIVRVARATPHIRHWLPTRETAIVARLQDPIPANLTIRISQAVVDPVSLYPANRGLSSSVVTHGATCPAYRQGGRCLDCRQCWDPTVSHVSYLLH